MRRRFQTVSLERLSGKYSWGDLACVFGDNKQPMETPAPPLGGPRSPDSGPTAIFQTSSLRTWVNKAKKRKVGSPVEPQFLTRLGLVSIAHSIDIDATAGRHRVLARRHGIRDRGTRCGALLLWLGLDESCITHSINSARSLLSCVAAPSSL